MFVGIQRAALECETERVSKLVPLLTERFGRFLMLHKANYMRGFHIEARDGGVGHIDDFLIDENWVVRYLVVDTSNWPGGDTVIVPSNAVERVDPPNKKVFL